jgi:large subunit ribosomal protein L28
MAKCLLTGKRAKIGNRVSHSQRKTKHWQKPNVQKKRIWDETKGEWVRIKVSARGLRTITKKGLRAAFRDAGVDLA